MNNHQIYVLYGKTYPIFENKWQQTNFVMVVRNCLYVSVLSMLPLEICINKNEASIMPGLTRQQSVASFQQQFLANVHLYQFNRVLSF